MVVAIPIPHALRYLDLMISRRCVGLIGTWFDSGKKRHREFASFRQSGGFSRLRWFAYSDVGVAFAFARDRFGLRRASPRSATNRLSRSPEVVHLCSPEVVHPRNTPGRFRRATKCEKISESDENGLRALEPGRPVESASSPSLPLGSDGAQNGQGEAPNWARPVQPRLLTPPGTVAA